MTLSGTSNCQISGFGKLEYITVEYHRDGMGSSHVQSLPGCAGINDTTLKVHEESTRACRAVLMDKIEYFKLMFSGVFVESGAVILDLSVLFDDIKELTIVLDFIRTGRITLTEKNILSVVNTASLFLLTDLQEICSEFLLINISPSTCLNIFAVAERYSLKSVQDASLEVIKAWFPFNLWQSKEALKMDPHCLKVLIQEGVFDLLADDVKETFLSKWHHHFSKMSGGDASLPQEVNDLLQGLKPTEPQGNVPEGGENEVDEKVDILLTYVLPSNSIHHFVQVLAFSPKLKSWKLVLNHRFTSFAKPGKSVKLIGVSEHKVYFSFRDKGDRWDAFERVITVDLESKEETMIKLPSVYRPREYFLQGNVLCAFCIYESDATGSGHLPMFPEDDPIKVVFYRNDHENKCPKGCEGKCWDEVCEMVLPLESTATNYRLRSKVFQDQVFVWIQNNLDDVRTSMIFYHIRPSGYDERKWTAVKVRKWKQPSVNDKNFDSTFMSPIEVDRKASTLVFSLRLMSHNGHTMYKEYVYMYDVAKGKLKDVGFREVVYPEKGIRMVRKDVDREYDIKAAEKQEKRILAYENRLRRRYGLLEKDNEEYSNEDRFFYRQYDEESASDDDEGPEYGEEDYHYEHEPARIRQSFHGYHARSTTPYSTAIWKKEPLEDKFNLATYLPRPIFTFKEFKSTEMPLRQFKAMRNAELADFSEDIGHSAMANMRESSETQSKYKVEYEKFLNWETFELLWVTLWWKSIQIK